jgi:hypothetical protein
MSSTCLLWAFSANAADNAVTVTNGADINLKSKDLGAGLQLMQHGILDTAGNEILGLLTASPAATSISGRLVTINTSLSTINTTLGTPFQAGGSIGNTTFAATQSGVWNITNISGTITLPTGASTAAKQPALGTAGTASADVITVQGIASMTPLLANATLSAETTKVIGTVNISAGQSVTVTQGTASNLNATVVGTGTLAVQLTGATNNINNISGTITLPTLAATSTKQSDGTQKTQIVDGAGAVIASTSNNLNVQCANCSGSGVSTADAASFTPSVSLFAGGGGFFQTTATSNALTTGQQGMFQVTSNRALFTNLRNAAGTEIGTSTTPLQVSVANTGANGTAMLVTGTGGTFPVTATNLSVNISQINAVTPLMGNGVTGTGSQRVTIASDNTAFSVNATLSAETTKVIGTVNQGTSPWVNNTSQINGVTVLMGNGVTGTGSQRVTIASDNTAFSVNATLTAETTKVIGTVRNVGNIGGVTDFIGQNATTPANAWLVGCGFNTTPTTITTGNSSPLQCDNAGKLLVAVSATNLSTNVAQINGVTPLMGNGVTGTGSPRVTIASDGTAISTAGYMSVKIDQTTVGTTNAISLAQINTATTLAGNGATGTGAQRVTIANDNSLPSGWASSVAIASTTSGQTGPLAQCAVTTAAPTYTTAQTDPLSCDTAGGLRVSSLSVGVGATAATPPANASYVGLNVVSGGPLLRGATALALGTTFSQTIAIVDASGNQITSFGGAGGTSSNYGSAFPSAGTAVGFTDGTNMVAGRVGAVSNVAAATNQLNTLAVGQYNSAPLSLTDTRYNTAQMSVGGNLRNRPGADWGTITTWTTATSVNTNLVVSCGDSAPTVLIDIVGSGTITLGVISFQYANDATDCSGTTGTFVNLPTSAVNQQYPLLAGTNPLTLTTGQTAVALSTRGTRVIRARLTTAITGSGGQVIISPTVSSVNPLLDALINPLATGSNIIGKVGIDQTTPGTTNATSLSYINAAATLAGNGVTGTGSQRVTIASDNTAFSVNATLSAETTKVIGTVNISAAQTVATVTNLAQMNGAALLMGNGVTGTGSQRVTIASDNTAFSVNATLSAETTKVIGTVRNLGNAGGAFDAATGAAPPANAVYVGANTSGATGGLVQGLIQCNSSAIYDASTNGSTELVALSSGRIIYVCGYSILAGGTVNVKLIYGTSTNCSGGPTAITPAFQLTAQVGLVDGSPFARGLKTAVSNALCINTSAGTATQAIVYYAQL